MHSADPVLIALDRTLAALSDASTSLTLAMLAAGRSPLAHDMCVLADAVEAELAAVAAVLSRYRED